MEQEPLNDTYRPRKDLRGASSVQSKIESDTSPDILLFAAWMAQHSGKRRLRRFGRYVLRSLGFTVEGAIAEASRLQRQEARDRLRSMLSALTPQERDTIVTDALRQFEEDIASG